MQDGRPSGAGWDWLVKEAQGARFTLIGEEHGVAETNQLSAALWNALCESGYRRMAIELSPVIAEDIEAAGTESEQPSDSYWVGFTVGSVVYVMELHGPPGGSVSEEQSQEIASAYYDRLKGN